MRQVPILPNNPGLLTTTGHRRTALMAEPASKQQPWGPWGVFKSRICSTIGAAKGFCVVMHAPLLPL